MPKKTTKTKSKKKGMKKTVGKRTAAKTAKKTVKARKKVKKSVKKTIKKAVKKGTKKTVKKKVSRVKKSSSSRSKKTRKLTKPELKEYRKMLLDLKDEIVGEINHINQEARSNFRDSSGDLSSHTLHLADMADENFARELNLELASNEREILHAIDDGLRRIENGVYGICVDCEVPIPKSRLKVIPYTPLCKKCQEEREKDLPRY